MDPKLDEILIRLGKEFDNHKGEPIMIVEEEKEEENEKEE
jgi:hypothetical protein